MKKIKENLRKWPVARKLYGLLLPQLLILILLFSLLSERVYQNEIHQKMTNQVQTQFDAIADQIHSDINQISRLSFYLYGNMNIREGLEESVMFTEKFTLKRRNQFHTEVVESAFLLLSRLY